MSPQKIQGLAERFLVVLLRNISLAGGITLLDMVIQTGPLLARVLGKPPAAGSDPVQLVNQLQGVFYRPCAGKRAKIPAFPILFMSLENKSRGKSSLTVALI